MNKLVMCIPFVQIQPGACWLVLAGNVVTFLTIFGFVFMADRDDIEYSMW